MTHPNFSDSKMQKFVLESEKIVILAYYKSNPYLLKNWKRQRIHRNIAAGNRRARGNEQSLCN